MNHTYFIISYEKMIQLVAEIEQANADAPDIFDYIVEAFEIVMVRFIRCVNYIYSNVLC